MSSLTSHVGCVRAIFRDLLGVDDFFVSYNLTRDFKRLYFSCTDSVSLRFAWIDCWYSKRSSVFSSDYFALRLSLYAQSCFLRSAIFSSDSVALRFAWKYCWYYLRLSVLCSYWPVLKKLWRSLCFRRCEVLASSVSFWWSTHLHSLFSSGQSWPGASIAKFIGVENLDIRFNDVWLRLKQLLYLDNILKGNTMKNYGYSHPLALPKYRRPWFWNLLMFYL